MMEFKPKNGGRSSVGNVPFGVWDIQINEKCKGAKIISPDGRVIGSVDCTWEDVTPPEPKGRPCPKHVEDCPHQEEGEPERIGWRLGDLIYRLTSFFGFTYCLRCARWRERLNRFPFAKGPGS